MPRERHSGKHLQKNFLHNLTIPICSSLFPSPISAPPPASADAGPVARLLLGLGDKRPRAERRRTSRQAVCASTGKLRRQPSVASPRRRRGPSATTPSLMPRTPVCCPSSRASPPRLPASNAAHPSLCQSAADRVASIAAPRTRTPLHRRGGQAAPLDAASRPCPASRLRHRRGPFKGCLLMCSVSGSSRARSGGSEARFGDGARCGGGRRRCSCCDARGCRGRRGRARQSLSHRRALHRARPRGVAPTGPDPGEREREGKEQTREDKITQGVFFFLQMFASAAPTLSRQFWMVAYLEYRMEHLTQYINLDRRFENFFFETMI